MQHLKVMVKSVSMSRIDEKDVGGRDMSESMEKECQPALSKQQHGGLGSETGSR